MKDGEAKGRRRPSQVSARTSTAGGSARRRRPRLLQRRLAAARRRREGGHLRQRCRRGDVSTHARRRRWRDARRQQAQLHADLSAGSVPAGERLLVGDDVRRQDAVPDRESDQPLPDQLADAAEHEEERRRLADALHPEQIAGRRQGSQLAACAERPDLSGDAPLLAEDRATVDPAARRRHLEATGCRSLEIKLNIGRTNRRFEFEKRRQLFIRTHNETLSVVAICVCNEGCSVWILPQLVAPERI